MRDWILPIALLALFGAVMADGVYNEWRFAQRCHGKGGFVTGYNNVCVKPGGVITIQD